MRVPVWVEQAARVTANAGSTNRIEANVHQVLSRIMARSNSAKAPTICIMMRPAGVGLLRPATRLGRGGLVTRLVRGARKPLPHTFLQLALPYPWARPAGEVRNGLQHSRTQR